ncbi:hypothetical protein HK101_005527, partial [Irineochytrium annulatum]
SSLVTWHGVDPNRIGAIGYGSGGLLALRLAGRPPRDPSTPFSASNPPDISCVAFADPTNIPGLFDIRRIRVDTLWLLSSADSASFPAGLREAARAELAVRRPHQPRKLIADFVMFEDVAPGFATRGHWGDRVGGDQRVASAADVGVGKCGDFFGDLLLED